jgi:hypothetical protein
MNTTALVTQNRLKPADAVMLRKKLFGMVDHYVIYAGRIDGRHRFIANHNDGVSFVSDSELRAYSQILEPKHIERFQGTEVERQHALKRAYSALGKPYKLLSSNCEHFKTWVHEAKWSSPQVKKAAQGTAIAGAALAVGGLATKNNKAALWGLGLLALGLIVDSMGDDD